VRFNERVLVVILVDPAWGEWTSVWVNRGTLIVSRGTRHGYKTKGDDKPSYETYQLAIDAAVPEAMLVTKIATCLDFCDTKNP
jgi:hypothetical protein